MTTDKSIEVLNSLLIANNNRILGYEKAAAAARELDLQTIFKSMTDDSKRNVAELSREIKKLGGAAVEKSASVSGKLYTFWMSVKIFLTGNYREAMLQSSQYLEATIQNTYRAAISLGELSTEIRQLLRNEQAVLNSSNDLIREYRERSQYGYSKSF